ncbi:MFS transporter [Saccharopolyspora sp. ASAGF58]|nr:MFS transporter [Saccharopolyspora sp. ASAGF58]
MTCVWRCQSSRPAFATSWPYLLITYIPTYLKTSVGLTDRQSLIAQTASLVLICLLLPVCGGLSDKVGRKPLMLASTILYVATPLPAFLLFREPSVAAAFGGMALIVLAQAASTAIAAVVISEMFPTRGRYSSASISYNVAYMLFGGTAPLVATWLVSATGSTLVPAYYVMVIAAVSTVFVFLLPETLRAQR